MTLSLSENEVVIFVYFWQCLYKLYLFFLTRVVVLCMPKYHVQFYDGIP